MANVRNGRGCGWHFSAGSSCRYWEAWRLAGRVCYTPPSRVKSKFISPNVVRAIRSTGTQRNPQRKQQAGRGLMGVGLRTPIQPPRPAARVLISKPGGG